MQRLLYCTALCTQILLLLLCTALHSAAAEVSGSQTEWRTSDLIMSDVMMSDRKLQEESCRGSSSRWWRRTDYHWLLLLLPGYYAVQSHNSAVQHRPLTAITDYPQPWRLSCIWLDTYIWLKVSIRDFCIKHVICHYPQRSSLSNHQTLSVSHLLAFLYL